MRVVKTATYTFSVSISDILLGHVGAGRCVLGRASLPFEKFHPAEIRDDGDSVLRRPYRCRGLFDDDAAANQTAYRTGRGPALHSSDP